MNELIFYSSLSHNHFRLSYSRSLFSSDKNTIRQSYALNRTYAILSYNKLRINPSHLIFADKRARIFTSRMIFNSRSSWTSSEIPRSVSDDIGDGKWPRGVSDIRQRRTTAPGRCPSTVHLAPFSYPTQRNPSLSLSVCPFPSLFRDEGMKGENGLNQRVKGLTRQRCQRVEIYGVFSTVRRNLPG